MRFDKSDKGNIWIDAGLLINVLVSYPQRFRNCIFAMKKMKKSCFKTGIGMEKNFYNPELLKNPV